MPAAPPKILIVDDEAANIVMLVEALKSDHTIFVAKNGPEALRLAAENVPDIILLDVRMPQMDGYEVFVQLRATPPTRNIPVIFVTAVETDENETRGLALGAVDYIRRPFTAAVVQARVALHLELARARRESESRYRAVFTNLADGVAIYDLEGRFMEVNEAFCRNTGYSRGELLNMGLADIDCQTAPELHAQRFDEVLKAGACIFETCHRCRNGSELPVEVHLRLIELDGPRAALAVCRDITQRKQADADLNRYREELEALVRQRTAELQEKEHVLTKLERELKKRRSFQNIVGQSEAMQSLYARLEDLADVNSTVIITGATGTGKELVAEALHYGGQRCKRPFVKVVCSDLPDNLIESELFGHVRGAFTGAVHGRVGRFEKAGNGTVFLDEIGDIPDSFQKRLLRVLEERRFERVGANTPILMKARIVAATHRDLAAMVQKGYFREDLYYRLKVVEVHLPELRRRRGDIPLLVEHFLAEFNAVFKRNIRDVDPEVLAVFMTSPWPGNIRQLKHVLESACLTCKGDRITVADLPASLTPANMHPAANSTVDPQKAGPVLEALQQARWNKTIAARKLGVSRQTLYRWIEELQLLEIDG